MIPRPHHTHQHELKALDPPSRSVSNRHSYCALKALGPPSRSVSNRHSYCALKALGPLAGSVRDILVRFAHSNRARAEPATSGRASSPDVPFAALTGPPLALSVRQENCSPEPWLTPFARTPGIPHSTATAGHTPPQPIRSLTPFARSSLARRRLATGGSTARATARGNYTPESER